MKDPTLSIVTPSFNQASFIQDNLKSVLRQSDDDIEHIVIDGGSKDRTIDILKEYEEKYRLRWISEPDEGQSHALNKGIEMANGEWIGWQNSDDYYVDGAFQKFRKLLKKNPGADVIYGDLVIVDANGEEIDRAYHIHPSKFVQRYTNIMANQAAFFRKSTLQDLGGIREDYHYCMDIDLFWRLTHSDVQMVYTPDFLGCFRVVEDAKTGGKKTQRHKQERRHIQKHYGVPVYERFLPNKMLRIIALGLKSIYLLTEGRFEAFRQPMTKVNLSSNPFE